MHRSGQVSDTINDPRPSEVIGGNGNPQSLAAPGCVGDGGLFHTVVVGLGVSVQGLGTVVNVVRTGDGEKVITTVGSGGMLCAPLSEAAAMQYGRFTGRFEQSAISGFKPRISASLTCQSLAKDAHVSPG